MIEIDRLTKVYEQKKWFSFSHSGGEKVAVDGVSLTIEKGKVFGLLGVNGAGKTSLIKMLCTLLEPSGGRAVVGGGDVVKQAQQLRKKINMIAGGERALYWRLTGRENLAYFAKLYNVPAREENKRIEALLALVGLSGDAHVRVERYSKGMKQRLQIARGLVNEPEYLFMDEPTIGLDAPIAREIRGLIKRELRSTTVLFTSHYMDEVEELCDEVAILHHGKIVTQGTVGAIKREYTAGFVCLVTVGSDDERRIDGTVAALSARDGVRVSRANVERGVQLRIQSREDIMQGVMQVLGEFGLRILELRSVERNLEDVLVEVSKQGGL